MGLRAGLGVLEQKIACCCQDSNRGPFSTIEFSHCTEHSMLASGVCSVLGIKAVNAVTGTHWHSVPLLLPILAAETALKRVWLKLVFLSVNGCTHNNLDTCPFTVVVLQ